MKSGVSMGTAQRFQRALVWASDVALALAMLSFVTMFARVAAVRNLRIGPELLIAVIGMFAVPALVTALCATFVAPEAKWGRWAFAIVGLAVAILAYWLDATMYVRLYGRYHASLGLVTLIAATLLRTALPTNTRALKPRIAMLLLAVCGSLLILKTQLAVRAYAAQRGVLMADVFWATNRDVENMPDLPQLHMEPTSVARPLPARPSLILFVTVDALRLDAAQSSAFRTISVIRSNAVDFTDARATAAWTVPSVYSLMTARGPWRATWTRTQFFGDSPVEYTGSDRDPRRVWPLPLHDRAVTLAQALHAVGYQTRTCASLPFFVHDAGIARGFDQVDEGVYRQRNRDLRGSTSDLLTGCGLAMIEAAHGAPLFLWLHYSDPHEPYLLHGPPLPGADSAAGRYASEVQFVDQHLRGLLLNVQQMVGLQNTMIVFTADHGEEFEEHDGQFHAVALYDEIERVPLMISAPGIQPRRVTTPVSLLDVAPTILELVGAAPLASTDGRSLVAAMHSENLAPRPVFSETIRHGRGVRSVVDGRFKLIYERRAQTYELYDLLNDPTEQNIVSDAHRDVVDRLAREMGVPTPSW